MHRVLEHQPGRQAPQWSAAAGRRSAIANACFARAEGLAQRWADEGHAREALLAE
ncbi:MAG: hypothetical protein AB1760_02620 [Pseudomonadota bacterium]